MVTRCYEEQAFDPESFEMVIRDTVHGIGATMLEGLINADGGDYRGRIIPCEKGHVSTFKSYRSKTLLTVLGPVSVKRAYYADTECHAGFCPKDRALAIEGTSYSPGVRRMMSKVGSFRPFDPGHQDLYELAGIRVCAKEVERVAERVGHEVAAYETAQGEAALSATVIPLQPIARMYVCMDGTGVPVVKKETEGRQGKDSQPKTREAKLGCVFTQTTVDKEGRPVRDEASTSYTGAIETAEQFGWRLYQEAKRRGMDRARDVNVLGDGALWIWNIADEHFPRARQIVDLYHAREHYGDVARACLGQEKEKMYPWMEQRRLELDEGKVEDVISAIKHLSIHAGTHRDICERERGYFDKNKERMRYAAFRRLGLFVGSGVLEAGCRSVIGQRLKQSGMHWTVEGANKIIALRCNIMSNRWEDFWEQRVRA